MQKKIYVLMGPSGSGKTTLGNELKKMGIVELINTTTRDIRIGEIPNVSYYFVNADEFRCTEMIEKTEYAGNYYGMSKIEVDTKLSSHDRLYTILDSHGAMEFKKIYGSDVVKIIYIYCSQKTLEERMILRGDSVEKINERLDYITKTGELDNIGIADYVIINDKNTYETSVSLLKTITNCDL